MKTPPLLLGTSLLFWGWQTNLLFLAVPLAIIIEFSLITNVRWEFSFSDLKRISDACTLIFISIIIFFSFSTKPSKLIFIVFQWMPVCFIPLIIAQTYNLSDTIDVRPVSSILRKKSLEKPPILMNISYIYFVLCIIAASFANQRIHGFYISLILLCCFAAFPVKSKRYSYATWICLLILGSGLGHLGNIGIGELQIFLEKKTLEWFFNIKRFDPDPYHSTTAIGEIGKLKQSNRILFRVSANKEQIPSIITNSILLREASYNMYGFSNWYAEKREFITILSELDETTWKLNNVFNDNAKMITISQNLNNDMAMLKLPIGAFQIEKLTVFKMSKNLFGAVKVEKGPDIINYQVKFDPESSFDAVPDKNDLIIPKREFKTVQNIANKLLLNSMHHDNVLNKVEEFFRKEFFYSLKLDYKNKINSSPISYFLEKSKTGHCEYFATATVLILRAAGIPARYATGFMVNEFSSWENKFLVRQKDAHAWAIAYIDGKWQNFDTTPISWISYEKEDINIFQPVSDKLSWAFFSFYNWYLYKMKDSFKNYSKWLLVPLTIILIRQLYIPKKAKKIKGNKNYSSALDDFSGIDSPFFQIEKWFKNLGYERKTYEPLLVWIKNIENEYKEKIDFLNLYQLLKYHYKYRFDPYGLLPEEKIVFFQSVKDWITVNNNNYTKNKEV